MGKKGRVSIWSEPQIKVLRDNFESMPTKLVVRLLNDAKLGVDQVNSKAFQLGIKKKKKIAWNSIERQAEELKNREEGDRPATKILGNDASVDDRGIDDDDTEDQLDPDLSMSDAPPIDNLTFPPILPLREARRMGRPPIMRRRSVVHKQECELSEEEYLEKYYSDSDLDGGPNKNQTSTRVRKGSRY